MRYENKNLYIRKRELNEIQTIKKMKIDNNISYEIYKKNLFNIEGIQKYLNLTNYKYPILELNNIMNLDRRGEVADKVIYSGIDLIIMKSSQC